MAVTSHAIEATTVNRTRSAMVGSWCVRAVVTSTGPYPPEGAVIYGLIVFTSDGIVTPLSSCTAFSVGTAGCGVWQELPNRAPSASFSFMEHASKNNEWQGCNYIHAPEVNFSDDGTTFVAPVVQILKRDIHGAAVAEFTTTLHGTRIALNPAAQMPQQIL